MRWEDALRKAHENVLPAGYKPEDYYLVDNDRHLPIRIAKMIIDEANHLMAMSYRVHKIASG